MPDLLYYIFVGLLLLLGFIVALRKQGKANGAAKARFHLIIVVIAAAVVLTILWLGVGGIIFGGC